MVRSCGRPSGDPALEDHASLGGCPSTGSRHVKILSRCLYTLLSLLLGPVACSVPEYGPPRLDDYRLDGKTLSARTGEAIEGIAVQFRDHQVLSASDGTWIIQASVDAGSGPAVLRVHDIDGEANGGFFCRAGINVAGIMVNGDILACPNIDRRFTQGNIRSDSFLDVWEYGYEAFRDRNWMKTGPCETCEEWAMCQGGCFHLRDYETRQTKLCHVRAFQLI